MKYLSKKPFTGRASTPEFRRNWDETFGQKLPAPQPRDASPDQSLEPASMVCDPETAKFFSRDVMRLLSRLASIADAYDRDELDEARPEWGGGLEHDLKIELLAGRGGRTLLTLGDAFAARDAARKMRSLIQHMVVPPDRTDP